MDHDHDHTQATHKITCPYCAEELLIHVHDDEEAVTVMSQVVKTHLENVHEDEEMDEESAEEMIRENIERL